MTGRLQSTYMRLAAPLLLLALPAGAGAQGMPFHTPTALPLPLAESSIRSFYQHMEMRTLLQNGREIPNTEDLRVDVDAVALMVPHGVAPRTFVMAGVPYISKTFDRTGSTQSNSGFGDALVLVKQEILAKDFVAGNRRLAIFAGATFPTGQTEDRGSALPEPLRLGLGTVNVMGQAVYSYVDDRLGFHGAAAYTAATASKFGVRVGDRFHYDAALGFRVFPAVYKTLREVTLAGYLELNATVQQPATQGGDPLPNTGGHTAFLSPGLQVIPLPNWAIEASFQFPVVRELRGTQLGPNWSLSVGARTVLYLFGS